MAGSPGGGEPLGTCAVDDGTATDRDLRTEMEVLRRTLALTREENERLRAQVAELTATLGDAVGPAAPPPPSEEPGAGALFGSSGMARREHQRVIEHLRKEACVHLAPSRIAGVGVFAFRPIPARTDPFRVCNPHMASKEQFSVCTAAELRGVPESVFAQVQSFFAPLTEDDGWTPQRDADGELLYGVLTTGLSSLNLSWYLNHSDEPNISFQEGEEEGEYNSFVTKRRIEEGEELTVDYRELGREYYALVSRPR